nr:MAG TPA: lambda repressor [Caudoviricetes sp.]
MTKTKFARCIGMTYNSLASKMNGDSPFKVSEASEIAVLLNLTDEEIVSIFFAR